MGDRLYYLLNYKIRVLTPSSLQNHLHHPINYKTGVLAPSSLQNRLKQPLRRFWFCRIVLLSLFLFLPLPYPLLSGRYIALYQESKGRYIAPYQYFNKLSYAELRKLFAGVEERGRLEREKLSAHP
jgi:hypothetical protein